MKLHSLEWAAKAVGLDSRFVNSRSSYSSYGFVLGLVRRFWGAFALFKIVFITFNMIKTIHPSFYYVEWGEFRHSKFEWTHLDMRVDFAFLQRFSRWMYSNWPVKKTQLLSGVLAIRPKKFSRNLTFKDKERIEQNKPKPSNVCFTFSLFHLSPYRQGRWTDFRV